MTIQAFKRKIGLTVICTCALLVIFGFIFSPPIFAATEATAEPAGNSNVMWVCISAAFAFAMGAIAAGIAISNVGSAAMGAISEKPEIASQALIFIALAEGLVVFGFITALMILGKA